MALPVAFNPPSTIAAVIDRLEAILDECSAQESRLGFFAALYHKVTCRVQQGILNGAFEDGPRMERLDVLFAARYLEAYDCWKRGAPCSESWKVAFEAGGKRRYLLLHHLLQGINAHINLDLGIAAVETAGAEGLQAVQKDFDAINTILAALSYEVMTDISRLSPLLSLLGLHGSSNNSVFVQFALTNARDGAWRFAEELAGKAGADRIVCIRERDRKIHALGTAMLQGSFFLKLSIFIIRLFERGRPSYVINALRHRRKAYFRVTDAGVRPRPKAE